MRGSRLGTWGSEPPWEITSSIGLYRNKQFDPLEKVAPPPPLNLFLTDDPYANSISTSGKAFNILHVYGVAISI